MRETGEKVDRGSLEKKKEEGGKKEGGRERRK